jgi:hypothetical protein
MRWNEDEVLRAITQGQYVNAVGIIDALPSPRDARKVLDSKLGVCRDRSSRLVLVEKVGEYMVLIAIPDGKTECDFRVWRYAPNLKPQVRIPTHDYLGEMFIELKKRNGTIDEYLINAVIRLLRDRWSVDNLIQHYFNTLNDDLKDGIRKFLATLKWVGLQEDVNYPPPKYLGSKMSLAVYALLESGFSLSDIRRVIRF